MSHEQSAPGSFGCQDGGGAQLNHRYRRRASKCGPDLFHRDVIEFVKGHESDVNGAYSLIIGAEVDSLANIPAVSLVVRFVWQNTPSSPPRAAQSSENASRRNYPLRRLAGDLCDQIEILVVVKDR